MCGAAVEQQKEFDGAEVVRYIHVAVQGLVLSIFHNNWKHCM